MAVLALATVDPTDDARRLVDAGTLWLLQQKDRYGVWYSGQATVDVLSALLKGIDTKAYRIGAVKPRRSSRGYKAPLFFPAVRSRILPSTRPMAGQGQKSSSLSSAEARAVVGGTHRRDRTNIRLRRNPRRLRRGGRQRNSDARRLPSIASR
jgi:hypothetical protein